MGYLSERLCYIPEKGRRRGGWFNELLKRTQMLVNSLRAGEPSCLALGPEVSDLALHPDREREVEGNSKKKKKKQTEEGE